MLVLACQAAFNQTGVGIVLFLVFTGLGKQEDVHSSQPAVTCNESRTVTNRYHGPQPSMHLQHRINRNQNTSCAMVCNTSICIKFGPSFRQNTLSLRDIFSTQQAVTLFHLLEDETSSLISDVF